jgi:rRNA processing protein Gar1
MNLGFVNKIISAIFKIIEYIQIKKKSKTMPDNQQPTPAQPQPVVLGAKTVVQFTLKGFIGTIVTIMGVFASFYFMVFEPRADKVEAYQKELMLIQKTEMDAQFVNVNRGISANQTGILDLGKRFNDLDKAVKDIGDSSGGFGGSTTTSLITDEPAVDPRLALNPHQ